jgi:hypothetical protein
MRQAEAASVPPPAARFSNAAFIAVACIAVALTALVARGARSWIDQPFAGFYLRADRTIAPIGRSDEATARLYDRTLVAVDGVAVTASDDLHRYVAARPIGSLFHYTVSDGTTTTTVAFHSRRFSPADYWAVFGAYLATGLAYVLLAILAGWALPSHRFGRALVLLGGVGGVYMLSAADLYPPAASLRVHALAAAFLPATLLQFAVVVGEARFRFARIALSFAWVAAALAAVSMQWLIGDPTAVRWVSATCDVTLGLALAAATVGVVCRVRTTLEAAPFFACTALFGLGIPSAIYLIAGTFGGVPVNASATLAFLFPLGMGVALTRDRMTLWRGPARASVSVR